MQERQLHELLPELALPADSNRGDSRKYKRTCRFLCRHRPREE